MKTVMCGSGSCGCSGSSSGGSSYTNGGSGSWSGGGGGSSSFQGIVTTSFNPINLQLQGQQFVSVVHSKNGPTAQIQVAQFTGTTKRPLDSINFNLKINYPPCFSVRIMIAFLVNDTPLLGSFKIGASGGTSIEFYPFNNMNLQAMFPSIGGCRGMIPAGTKIQSLGFSQNWIHQ